MCTLGARKIQGRFCLFKNRDRADNVNTRVVVQDDKIRKLLIVDEKSHLEGLNEFGIGFVEATLSPHGIRKYKTVSQIGRRILNQKTIKNAIEVIKRNKISSNILISDGRSSYIIERTPNEFSVTRLIKQGVLTNHSLKLDRRNGPKKEKDMISSKKRLMRGRILVKGINDLKDIENFLSDKKDVPYSIRNLHTKCSYIYNLHEKKILFYVSIPNETIFREYEF